MKRISKRTRQQAARICSIAASDPMFRITFGVLCVATWTGSTARAANLALSALLDAFDPAEAEALLRTGWSPS